MTTLNKRIKEQIVKNAINKSGIPARKDDLKKQQIVFAEAVRVDSLGGIEESKKYDRIVKRFKKATKDLNQDIVKNVFQSNSYMYLNAAGSSYYLKFGGSECNHSDNIYKIAPSEHVIKHNNPLFDEFNRLESLSGKIDDDVSEIRSNVHGILLNIRTVKKLIEVWPESGELLPDDMSPPKKLPVPITKDLNKMIGLPSPV